MDVALRLFLGRFQLPGEGQQIGRILEAFAQAFHSANPRDYSVDGIAIVAFSAILLHTEYHNVSIRGPLMSKASYLRNTKAALAEVTDSVRFPDAVLLQLFRSFSKDRIQLIRARPVNLAEAEIEVPFGPGRLGLQVETALDGHSCAVVYYDRTAPATADWKARPPLEVPDIRSWIVTSVNDDSTYNMDYSLVLWMLKSSHRPLVVRFCEPCRFFQGQHGREI